MNIILNEINFFINNKFKLGALIFRLLSYAKCFERGLIARFLNLNFQNYSFVYSLNARNIFKLKLLILFSFYEFKNPASGFALLLKSIAYERIFVKNIDFIACYNHKFNNNFNKKKYKY